MSDATAKPSRMMALIRRCPKTLLLLICLIAWLPGFFTIPPLDRDESRFAQASKQMLETHDFIDTTGCRLPRQRPSARLPAARATGSGPIAYRRCWEHLRLWR
jgi:hypothetical protein